MKNKNIKAVYPRFKREEMLNAKLSEADVIEMRELYVLNVFGAKRLADLFGVCKSTAYGVVHPEKRKARDKRRYWSRKLRGVIKKDEGRLSHKRTDERKKLLYPKEFAIWHREKMKLKARRYRLKYGKKTQTKMGKKIKKKKT